MTLGKSLGFFVTAPQSTKYKSGSFINILSWKMDLRKNCMDIVGLHTPPEIFNHLIILCLPSSTVF